MVLLNLLRNSVDLFWTINIGTTIKIYDVVYKHSHKILCGEIHIVKVKPLISGSYITSTVCSFVVAIYRN